MAKFADLSEATFEKAQYNNGRTALIAKDEQGQVLMKCSVNIPALPVEEGEILIKNYSENEGVIEDLLELGIIDKQVHKVPYGWNSVHICKLLI